MDATLCTSRLYTWFGTLICLISETWHEGKILPGPEATAVIHQTLEARICGPVGETSSDSGIAQEALRKPPVHKFDGGWITRVTQKWEPPGRPGIAEGNGVVSNGFLLADTVNVTSTQILIVKSEVTVSKAGWASGRSRDESSSAVVWWWPVRKGLIYCPVHIVWLVVMSWRYSLPMSKRTTSSRSFEHKVQQFLKVFRTSLL